MRRILLVVSLVTLGALSSACGESKKAGEGAKPAAKTAAAAPAEPMPAVKTAEPPVTNPDMDPRVVEPCVSECRSLVPEGKSPGPEYFDCFNPCKVRKADEINAAL